MRASIPIGVVTVAFALAVAVAGAELSTRDWIRRNAKSIGSAFGRRLLSIVLVLISAPAARACLWDSDTLLEERITSPRMAAAVLDPLPRPDVSRLKSRIVALRRAPRETDPAWWNDLAGAHIRLGEPGKAVELLETAVRRFPNDYGVHANLGTAYHLLGRYREAEREIARDLVIQPGAHFGLERYHLALLQYLVRDPEYQARHLYVDEWTYQFLAREPPHMGMGPPGKRLPASATNSFQPVPESDGGPPMTLPEAVAQERDRLAHGTGRRKQVERELAALKALSDRPPPYRYRWDLARDPKFIEGVIYMASLNPGEPACYVMLGVASAANQDLNLAAAAFRRAVDGGSPQTPLLTSHIQAIELHRRHSAPYAVFRVGGWLVLAVLIGFLFRRIYRVILLRRATQRG